MSRAPHLSSLEASKACLHDTGEYESLQTLHQWRIDFFRADRFELVYSEEIRLSLDCSAFVPNIASREVALVPHLSAGQMDPLTLGLFELLRLNLKIKSKGSFPSVSRSICLGGYADSLSSFSESDPCGLRPNASVARWPCSHSAIPSRTRSTPPPNP